MAAGALNPHGAVLSTGHFLNPACGTLIKRVPADRSPGEELDKTMPLEESDLAPENTINCQGVLFVRKATADQILKNSKEAIATDDYKTLKITSRSESQLGEEYSPYQAIVEHPDGPGPWAWKGFECYYRPGSMFGYFCGAKPTVDLPEFAAHIEALPEDARVYFTLNGIAKSFSFEQPDAAYVHPSWLEPSIFKFEGDAVPPTAMEYAPTVWLDSRGGGRGGGGGGDDDDDDDDDDRPRRGGPYKNGGAPLSDDDDDEQTSGQVRCP